MSSLLEDPKYTGKAGLMILSVGFILGSISDFFRSVQNGYTNWRIPNLNLSQDALRSLQLTVKLLILFLDLLRILIAFIFIHQLLSRYLPKFQVRYASLRQIIPFSYIIISLGYLLSVLLRGLFIDITVEGSTLSHFILRNFLHGFGPISNIGIGVLIVNVLNASIFYTLIFIIVYLYIRRDQQKHGMDPENEKPAK